MYLIECVENISIFTSAQHKWKFWRFQLTQSNIFGINQKSFFFKNKLYNSYKLHAMSHSLKKGVLKMQKEDFLLNPNTFGTKLFVTLQLKKCITTLDVFVHK